MADPLIATPGQTMAPPDWDALSQQHGGIKSSVVIPMTDPRIASLIAADPTRDFTQHPIYRYYMNDGTYVEAYGQENGQDVQIVDYKPSAKFTQTQSAAQAPKQTPQEIREEAERAKNAALPGPNPNGATETERRGQDPRSETDAQRAARADATIKQQGQDARQAQIDAAAAADKAHDNRVQDEAAARAAKTGGTIVERPDGSYLIKPDGTATKVQGVPPPDAPKGTLKDTPDGTFLISADGKTATKVQGLPAPKQEPYTQVTQDKDSGKWFGLTKEGKWVEMQGGPGASQPRVAGPPMPAIILGHSQEALKEYGAQLDAEVAIENMTPAQRTARFNEALQVAQQTVNEATLTQRSDESNLNASVNLANSRLSASTTGFGQALSFVQNLNGTLPKGSGLGGQAFAAILGLQLAQAQKMGAYDNIVPGSQQPVGGDAVTRADTTATLAAQPRVDPAQGQARPNPPAPSAPASAEVDAQQQAAVAAAPAVSTTGPTGNVPRPDGPDTGAMVTIESASGARMQVPREMVGEGPGQYSAAPNRGGYHVVTDTTPVNPLPGEPGNNPNAPVGQAAGSQEDFAVLRNAPPGVPLDPPTPMPTMAQAQPTSPAPDSGPPPAALLHTQARMTPPWQLSSDQVQQMRAAGVPEDAIWGVPGRAA